MRETNPCFGCGCYDADYGCSMPSVDKWYACPLEADEEEMLQIKEDENSGVKWVNIEDSISLTNENKMKPIYAKLNDRIKSL